MTDEQLFESACVQIVLVGERGSDGSLTISGCSYDDWPETITVNGQRFRFSDEEGDREFTGTTPENASEPETVRAFYDNDTECRDDPDTCERCGEEMDKDCQGEPRCPECDPPCPSCDDGGGPV